MPALSITMPTDQVARINDAFAAIYGWDPAGTVTKPAFAKQQVIQFIRDVVAQRDLQIAEAQAREAAAGSAPNLT